MMQAKTGAFIFIRALALVWQYRGFALRVCLPIYLLAFAIDTWIRLQVMGEITRGPLQWHTHDPYAGAPENGASLSQILTIWAVWISSLITIAILWHRYVLGAHGVGPIAPLGLGQPLAYLGKLLGAWSLVIIPFGLISGIAMAFIIPGLLHSVESAASFSFAGIVIFTVLGIAMGWGIMRLSLALPEAAIGQPGSIFDSWFETRPLAGALWVTAALEMGLFTAISYLGDAVAALDIRLAYLVENLAWFGPALVGIAILTLLYEHLYHGRALWSVHSGGLQN